MNTINYIKEEIEKYLSELSLELEAQKDWNKSAKERYEDDLKFFWREWCDRWEVEASNDAVSKVMIEIKVLNNVLNLFQ